MALLIFLAVLYVFWAFGDRVRGALGVTSASAGEGAGISIAIAYGVVTLSGFLVALFRVAYPVVFWVLLAGLAAVSLPGLRSNFVVLRDRFRRIPWRPRRELAWWAWALTAVFVVLGLVVALAPPTGMDAGVLHFTTPKRMLQEHGLRPERDIFFHRTGGFYFVTLFGMAVGDEILAKLLNFGTVLASLLLLSPRPIAAFILAASPLAAGFAGYEYLELPVVMYLLAGWVCLGRSAALAGAFTGLAAGLKMSAFPAVVLLVPLVRTFSRRTLPAGLAFAVTAGFWPLWNLATIGSPTFSYLEGQAGPVPEGVGGTAGALGRALLSLVTTSLYWTESAGPFVFAGVAGCGVFLRGEPRLPILLFLGSIALYFGVILVFDPAYLTNEGVTRYLAPCLVAFGAPAAAEFAAWASGRPWKAAIVLALLLPAAPLLVLKAGKAAVAAPAALGLEGRSRYLAKKVETFAACEMLNGLPRRDVRVLFLAYRPYYLDRPFVWGAPEAADADAFVRRLRELGVTHVLLEPGYKAFQPWVPGILERPPFREVARWPGHGKFVLLYEVAPR